jgi:hypothetical protein
MVNKNSIQENYFNRLSILIQQGGFSFYLHGHTADKTLHHANIQVDDIHLKTNLKLFEKELEKLLSLHDIRHIKLVFANELYGLVPEECYDERAKADYLKYNVQLLPEDQIVAESIAEIEAVLLFIPYMDYHNLILEYVEEFEFTHFCQLLIVDARKKAVQNSEKLKVIIRQNQLDVIGFEGFNFKMCNTFNFNSDVDIAYYILFCVEELGFSQKDMRLYISHYQKNGEWAEILRRYIKNVYIHEEEINFLA